MKLLAVFLSTALILGILLVSVGGNARRAKKGTNETDSEAAFDAIWKPPRCGMNEVWSDCADPYPKTCSHLTSGRPAIARHRPIVCLGGCDCKRGYVRNDNYACVLPKHCPKKGSKAKSKKY